MITAIWAIFYLWLVLSMLLAAMWFLHRQDRLRDDQPEDDVLLPAMDAPLSKAAKRADAAARESESVAVVEPEPAKKSSTNGSGNGSKSGTKTGSGNGASPTKSSNGTNGSNGKASENSVPQDEPTIGQLLDGITLPYGLARAEKCIVDSGRHAVYLSAHPNAEEVGTAFADQLAGLGYSIEPSGFDQALATRDGQKLSMRIAANAGTDDNGNSGRYPHAADSDVAIEVWTGDGPAPSIKD